MTDAQWALLQDTLRNPDVVIDTRGKRGICFYSPPLPDGQPYGGLRLQVITHHRPSASGRRGVVASYWFTSTIEEGEVLHGHRPAR